MSGSSGERPPLVADRRYKTRRPASAAASAQPPKKPRQSRRKAPAKARGPLGRVLAFFGGILWAILRLIWGFTWRVSIVVGLVVGAGVLYYASSMPAVEDLVDGRAGGSVTMLDREGTPFSISGQEFGGMIDAATVSPHLINAIVATEDRRFYWHPGVDPIGIASATLNNLRGTGGLRGGSTLTQQTAKLLCNGRPYDASEWESERAYEQSCRQATLWRKAQEAVYAMAMELVYTKEEILTIYMNRAYMGGGSYGAEAAANTFFGVTSTQLTAPQAAMLAGLLQSPSRLSPTNNLARSQDRSLTVLRLMWEQGYLTDAEYDAARASPAVLGTRASSQPTGGYFANWVLDTVPDYFGTGTTEDVIIATTLDPRIQAAAEAAMTEIFETRVRAGSEAQAAIVVMSADGAVRAMVGGRDVGQQFGFNRATQAFRQTGSAFKPFIYAAALDLGRSPLDMVMDSPITITEPGAEPWSPQNYDREFRGPVTMTDALVQSLNIPAVLVSEDVGRDSVRTVATMFGVQSELAEGAALALGVSESSLLEMVGAYAGILNGGSAVEPYGLIQLRFAGSDEIVMEATGGIGERVISQDSARQLTWMMHQVVELGTGARAAIPGWQLAGKTGTTTGQRDAWFIGFSGDYVAGVWMGYDDNTPLTGVTGSGLPADMWRATMVRVLEGSTPTPLPMLLPRAPTTGGTIGVADSGFITDGELDQLLEDTFGVPQPVDGTTTQDAVNDALDTIFQ